VGTVSCTNNKNQIAIRVVLSKATSTQCLVSAQTEFTMLNVDGQNYARDIHVHGSICWLKCEALWNRIRM
jgi:hypothetical protein